MYRYEGPEDYHSFIGQVMAYLGYTGGGEGPVEAKVRLVQAGDRSDLSCVFVEGDASWHGGATLTGQEDLRARLKDCLLAWYSAYTKESLGPWGTLIGVRPTKLVHHLLDRGLTAKQAAEELCRHYQTAPAAAQGLVAMAQLQRPYVASPGRTAALYIGIPYCSSHCLYCSFPSRLIGQEGESVLQQFTQALEDDLEGLRRLCRDFSLPVSSVYIGGGTPTCLPESVLARILSKAREICPGRVEWTVEAGRPDTAAPEKLALLRSYGVDRISVNPQTMQQSLLDALGRRHSVARIYDMFRQCRQEGFETINMDFIAGLPRQTLADMQENMEIVCQLRPENVTIHTLALKKKAPLFHHPLRLEIPPPEDVSAMLEVCRSVLETEGYVPYYMYRQKYMAASFANVGYALPGHIGRYNIEMMEERQTILAAGPGGATKFVRTGQQLQKLYMPKDIGAYIQQVQEKIRQRYDMCRAVYGGVER